MPNFDLTLAAEDDLTKIWLYTHETWGFEQAEHYYDLIAACCEAVGSGKARLKPVTGLQSDVHVHRCEQHYIFYLPPNTSPNKRPVILAILHGRMDFVQRLKDRL